MLDLVTVIPTYNRRELVARAIVSALSQESPLTHAVLVADDASSDGTLPHLRSLFEAEIAEGRLFLHACARTGDPAGSRNQGARAAPPSAWLAFLDSDDHWGEGRLASLAPRLPALDLVLETLDPLPEGEDPIRWFVARNAAVASGALLRRALFDEVGGFREGYYSHEKGKARAWGWEDYEMWLRALAALDRRGSLERFLLRRGNDVFIEPQVGGAGRVRIREQMRRELGTLLRVAPLLPARAYPLLARRIVGAAKASVLG